MKNKNRIFFQKEINSKLNPMLIIKGNKRIDKNIEVIETLKKHQLFSVVAPHVCLQIYAWTRVLTFLFLCGNKLTNHHISLLLGFSY